MTLETMTDDQFDVFFDSLPLRVQYLWKAGMVSGQKIIDEWYPKA